MFLIWGFGHKKVKSFGQIALKQCDNCGNERQWELIEISEWFTLFFIPLIPYGRKRLLVCPVCSYGIELSKEDFEQMKLNSNNV